MSATEHGFKAEVQQLLDLMIHSLYSDKEIFLRELVSNAADALDKVRFLELTRKDLVSSAGEPGIRLSYDGEARTLTIEDDGIGLSEAEAIKNLGTIAHSGSAEWLAALKEKPGDVNLIGQFGVGFYSAFMVAEQVTVESRSALPESGPAVRWTSEGKGSYRIEPSDREVRGTKITLKLREDDAEFCEKYRVRTIVRKHSNFVPWKIWLDDEQVNSGRAVWVESPSSVSEEDANAFYRTIASDWEDPLLRLHVSSDSPLQYHAMLFVPAKLPMDFWRPEAPRGPRLYAKRVMITEHAKDVLPEWLRFLRGVVDSEDIQLNVSREMVQKTPVVRKIRDALVKRFVKELNKLADAPADEVAEEGKKTGRARYAEIWSLFGMMLKEGYYSSHDHRELLLPLLRFNTLNHEDGSGQRSLAEYKAAMPEGQDAVWYVTGPNRETVLKSPHLEVFKKRGYDVLMLTDPVDEWLVRELEAYDGLPLKSVARGELSLEDEAGVEKADVGAISEWMGGLFEGQVAGVRSSTRLTDSPAVLVDDEAGMSSNMVRLLRQAREDVADARRFLELNPKHVIVKNLVRLKEAGAVEEAEPIARLLLDDAMLREGTVKDPAAIGRRLEALLERASRAALGAEAAAV